MGASRAFALVFVLLVIVATELLVRPLGRGRERLLHGGLRLRRRNPLAAAGDGDAAGGCGDHCRDVHGAAGLDLAGARISDAVAVSAAFSPGPFASQDSVMTPPLRPLSTPCFCSLISRLGWRSCLEIYYNNRHLCFKFASFKIFLTSAGVDSFFQALMILLHRRFEGSLLSPVLLPLNPRLSLQPLLLSCLQGPRWSVLPITGAEFTAFLLGHVQDTSPPLISSTAAALFKFNRYVSAPGLEFLEVFSDALASFVALCNFGFPLPKCFLYLQA